MEAEIKIYQSCWKNLWLILGCMLFTVGGIYMITDESCRLVNKIIGGWLGVIFLEEADCGWLSPLFTMPSSAYRI